MAQQVPVSPAARADDAGPDFGVAGLHEITPDLAYQRLAIVNVIFAGSPTSSDWVLIDAGVNGSAPFILRAAEARFGKDAKPAAIVMTHGHFDHAGALLHARGAMGCPDLCA